jgi:exopolysaccharide biosynthesis polyprenyl glycosylphosphotransferase
MTVEILGTPSRTAPASATAERDWAATAVTTAMPRLVSPRMELATLACFDALVAAMATATAWTARFGDAATAQPPYLVATSVFPTAWVAALALGGGYDRRVLADGPDEYQRVLRGGMWLALAIAVASFVLRLEVSRAFLAIAIPYAVLLTLVSRHLLRKRLCSRLLAGRALHRVAVVGTRARVERVTAHLARCSAAGYRVVGHVEPPADSGVDGNAGLRQYSRAALQRLVTEARRMGADTIAIASDGAVGDAGIRRLSWELERTGIGLLVVPNVADVAGPRIAVQTVAGLPILHIEEPVFSGGQRLVKECIDRLGAALLLVLSAPLLAIIAIVLLLAQGRPVLFRQERIGRDGRRFAMLKFRTMRNGADAEWRKLVHLNEHEGELFKIRDDPRVTRCGRLLRRCSLDELPQLWNVLTGCMSLVGPRPPLAREVELYGNDALRRLLVKPGITGLWQVSGRADLPWDEAVRLDLHYVENWSVGLDLTVLWRTLFAVMRRQGAY